MKQTLSQPSQPAFATHILKKIKHSLNMKNKVNQVNPVSLTKNTKVNQVNHILQHVHNLIFHFLTLSFCLSKYERQNQAKDTQYGKCI